MSHTTRREFMKQTVAGVCAAGLLPMSRVIAAGGVPTRPLGKTGVEVSILGLGGSHIGRFRRNQQEGITLVRKAIDMGVTFMDNAWEYGGGAAEEILGKALRDGYSDKVFLMTKHHGREKKMAQQHLEDSLRRLQTDVIDLWQFHECVYPKDPEMIYTQGALEVALEAKKAGKIRFIGFTGHKHPDIHKEMLERGFEWDAVQMPLNVMDAHFRSFQNVILPMLVERKIGVIAMKSLAAGNIQRANVIKPEEGINYVWSLPVSTLVSGIGDTDILEKNVALAQNFKPMSDEEKTALLARTKEAALTGEYEPFKTTRGFDGRLGRQIHGIARDAR